MTPQIRMLPADDREVYMAYMVYGSYRQTALAYGCDESSVRKRVKRYLGTQQNKNTTDDK